MIQRLFALAFAGALGAGTAQAGGDAGDPYACFGAGRYDAMREARSCEPELPPGVGCDQIRDYVARYGKARSIAWALRQGYSLHDIRQARRCLP